MRKTTKPLTLRRQTLRPLVADELARVVGGADNPFAVELEARSAQSDGGHQSICTRDISGCMPP